MLSGAWAVYALRRIGSYDPKIRARWAALKVHSYSIGIEEGLASRDGNTLPRSSGRGKR